MACIRVLVVLLGILGVTCGIPLSEFYPFGVEAGDTEIPSNDDGSSSAVDLPLPFPFFDTLHQTVYVSVLVMQWYFSAVLHVQCTTISATYIVQSCRYCIIAIIAAYSRPKLTG